MTDIKKLNQRKQWQYEADKEYDEIDDRASERYDVYRDEVDRLEEELRVKSEKLKTAMDTEVDAIREEWEVAWETKWKEKLEN